MKKRYNYLKKEQYAVYSEVKYEILYRGLSNLHVFSKAIILAYEDAIENHPDELSTLDLDYINENLLLLKRTNREQDLIEFYENNSDWVSKGIELCYFISQYEYLYKNADYVYSSIEETLDAFKYLKILEHNVNVFNKFIRLLNIEVIDIRTPDSDSMRTVIKAKVKDNQFNRLNSSRSFETNFLFDDVDETVYNPVNIINNNVYEFVIDYKPFHDEDDEDDEGYVEYRIIENMVCLGINRHKYAAEPTDLGLFMYKPN